MRLRREKGIQSSSNGPDNEGAASPRLMSRYGSQRSADGEGEEYPTRAEATAAVGGEDLDSERSTKYARLSADANGDIESRASDDDDEDDDDPAATNASDIDLDNDADQNVDADGEQGTEPEAEVEVEMDLAPDSPSDAIVQTMERADEFMSSQLATPERDRSPATQQSIEASGGSRSTRLPLKTRGKKPKGWHLRRENRHLREAVMKGSPIRSDRQESVDTLENNHPDSVGILKRLPGRRRAPHHDPSIEADMRRQLELKVAYRAVAKALKPLLAELGRRTAETLDSDVQAHEKCSEYDVINAQLDERLQLRLEVLDKQLQYEQARLSRVHEAHKDIAARRFEAKLDDCYENHLLKCEHTLLKLLRHAEMQRDAEATEDEAEAALSSYNIAEREAKGFCTDASEGEVGVIPDLFITNKTTGEREILPRQSDSRSRFYQQTAHYTDILQSRLDARQAQKQFDDSSLVTAPRDFAVFDGDVRAQARSELILITLLDAGHQIEANAAIEAERSAKESEARLQILASASEIVYTSVPAPVAKSGPPTATNGSVRSGATVPAQSRATPREKNRNNALSISNLVSSDPLPNRADHKHQQESSEISTYTHPSNVNTRPAWPQLQEGPEAPPLAPQSPRPPLLMQAYPGSRKEEHARTTEDSDLAKQRPRRSTSEYPPHPLGKDYAERRSEYPSLGQFTQPAQTPERANEYPAYPYPRGYGPESAPPYGVPTQPTSNERVDARLMPRHTSETSYPQPYDDRRHQSDRTAFGTTAYVDVNDRDRRQYETRGGEYSGSGQFRQPIPGTHDQSSPYSHYPPPDRRMLQPAAFAPSPDFRNDRATGQAQRMMSPRLAYDPARPEGRMVRRTPVPYENSTSQAPPPMEFRTWNYHHTRPGEGVEQWQHYPHPGAPSDAKQPPAAQPAARAPLFANSPPESRSMTRPGQPDKFPPNRDRSSPRQTARSKREHSQDRIRDKGRGERAEAPGYLFRPYQPPGAQGGPAESRPLQGAMPAPLHPSGSAVHGAPAPGYAQRGPEPGSGLPGSDMQRHLGQRIGQQLLPATLDPGRVPHPPSQSSHSSPRTSAGHHRQRSSTTSIQLPPEGGAGGLAYAGHGELAGSHRDAAGTASMSESGGRGVQQGLGAPQPWQQQPGVWPGFEAPYPPPQPSLQGSGPQGPAGSQSTGQMPRQAQPVIHWWQSEAPPARTTFIHAAQNGQQPSNKNLDGRYWRTRRRRPSSPR